ncbi:MAG TPA: hypothetical protein VM639_00805 [Dongiaceae bacterium]|nr:hypothetical protein [Dongiaceae bacterium]
MSEGCKITFENTLGAAVDAAEWAKVQGLYKDLSNALDRNGTDSRQILAQLRNAKSGSEVSQVIEQLLDQVVARDTKAFARGAARKIANEAKHVENMKAIDQAVAQGTNAGKALDGMVFQHALGTGRNLEATTKAIYAGYAGERVAKQLDALLGNSNRLARDPRLRDATVAAYQQIHLKQPVQKSLAADVARILYRVKQEQLAKLNSLGDRQSWASAGLPTRLDYNLLQGKREEFLKAMSRALDPATHGDLAHRQALAAAIYDTVIQNKGVLDPDILGEKLGTDTAPALNYARGAAWKSVNDQFGTGNFFDTMRSRIESLAQREAAIRLFGPDFRQGFTKLQAYAKRQGASDQALERAGSHFKQMTNTWVPEHQKLSRYLGIARNVTTASKLGMAVLSGFTDAPVLVHAMKQFYGAGVFESIGKILSSAGKGNRDYARYLGAWSEGLNAHVANRFGIGSDATDRLSSNVAKMTDLIMRFRGLELWSGIMKSGATRIMDAHLGGFIQDGAKFADLPRELQYQLGRFNIGESDWAKLGKTHLEDGELNLFKLPDENTQGLSLKQRLVAFYQDAVERGVLTPGLADKELLSLGGQPGSVRAELAKTLTQFSSFAVAAHRRTVYATIMNPSISATSKLTGLAALAVVATAVNMIGMQAREAAKGNALYKWDDPEFITKAIAQIPGGLPLQLMMQRFGSDVLGQILGAKQQRQQSSTDFFGPLAGSIVNLMSGSAGALIGELQGNTKTRDKNLRKLSNELLRDVPGQNLLFTAAIWRSLVVNSVADMLDHRGYRQAHTNALRQAHQQRIGGQLRRFIGNSLDEITR